MKTRWITTFVVATIILAHVALGQTAGSVNTNGVGTAGVVISSTAGYPDVDVKTGNNAASALRVFNSDNAELLRVGANGNVGIGTGTPGAKLHVAGNVRFAKTGPYGAFNFDISTTNPVLWLTSGDTNSYYPTVGFQTETAAVIATMYAHRDYGLILAGGANRAIMLAPNGAEALRAAANGNIGIGMSYPTQRLEISGKARIVGTQNATLAGDGTNYYGGGRQHLYGAPIYGTAEGDGAPYTYGVANAVDTYYVAGKAGAYIKGSDGWWYAGGGAGVVAMGGNAISGNGSNAEGGAGIYARGGLNAAGTRTYAGYFAGDVVVTGNIAAKYQDVAEWVPAVGILSAGTVVVLDKTHSNRVIPSAQPYDTSVAGVVSAQPGLILGEAGESKAMVATTGRVRVRVDASRQPIAIGDLLVTSGEPGVAMKSIPVDLQGIAMHRPGTVVGKALEPLDHGKGEILVLLSLQ